MYVLYCDQLNRDVVAFVIIAIYFGVVHSAADIIVPAEVF